VEAFTVERDDAGGFLTAVLKSVQAKGGDRSGIWMTEDAKHSTFLAQAVGVRVELHISHRPEVL
jgi:hypothetical protein